MPCPACEEKDARIRELESELACAVKDAEFLVRELSEREADRDRALDTVRSLRERLAGGDG